MNRSEEHTSELQSPCNLVCRLLLEKKKTRKHNTNDTTRRTYKRGNTDTKLRACVFPRCCSSCLSSLCSAGVLSFFFFFFFNDTATTEIYPLSLHDALPI